VTGGDLWLHDEQSGVTVLGDLVTLPVPFLDTACPQGWRAALVQVAASRFKIAVPGHGPPMTPDEVSRYRAAFDSFVDCANSQRPAEECGAQWAAAAGPMLGPDAKAMERANAMAVNYVAMLRANGGRSKYCEAPSSESP
jgi:glyoxylase-like metal-dependent hydrolase (beta-lactamase superfamily II)